MTQHAAIVNILARRIVPPLAHVTAGSSGLCYNYDATALPPRYRDHFFVCDFHGSSVYAFAVKPKEASFEVADGQRFIWSVLATACDFGADGAFYLSDWVEGWGLTGKGRIYRFANAEVAKNLVRANEGAECLSVRRC